jgi:ketosteroid isomerase-like protein
VRAVIEDHNQTRTQVLQALSRFEALVAARDPAILTEFADEPDVRLTGSEVRDVAVGPTEIAAQVRDYFDLPVRITWEWRRRDVSSSGNVAWIFAEGDLVLRGEGGEQRSPYRLIGVLERRTGAWRWRHFHGSEPRPDR